MRAAVLVAVLLAPTLALAEPVVRKPSVIWDKTPHHSARPPTASGLTSISHVIYMNNCLPNGCALSAGNDDAAGHRSSIAAGNVHMSAWSHGDAKWQALVQCTKDTYIPFDITIVTERPTTGRYSEIIVAGTSAELNPQLTGAGGVAPFLGCGASDDNVISFMFAGDGYDLNYLCGGVAQETCHVFGLDHELDADDPLTYLNLGSHKEFQNSNPRCGEELANPRTCQCGGSTQNTYTYLMNQFGPAHLAPASITVTSPKAGAFVKPGFPVRISVDDQVSLVAASMTVDGAASGMTTAGPYVFNAPATLEPGAHAVEVSATDKVSRVLKATVDVTVMSKCGADGSCAADTHCLDGYCLPGANVAGGLGATCTGNDECVTGQCASDGTTMLCAGACDMGSCPSGYDCLAAGANGICWPTQDSGGCAVGGGRGSLLMLVGLAMFATLRRRRR